MDFPNENCDVVITLKDNQTIKGKYDPAIGFMTSDGRMIWKENVLSYKALKDDKKKKQKIFLLQRVDSYDHFIDHQYYTTDEEIAKEWDNYYRRNYYYGQAIELEEFTDKEHIKEELESD